MKPINARMIAVVLTLILSATWAQGIQISVAGGGSGGSSSATVSLETTGSASGEFDVDGAIVNPWISVTGGSTDFTQYHTAEDSTGKKAEVYANIQEAGSFSYTDWVYPGTANSAGNIKKTGIVALVAAGQRVTASDAKYIECYAKATSSDGKTALVSTAINSYFHDAAIQEYLGESAASATSAVASQQITDAIGSGGVTTTSMATTGSDIFSVVSRADFCQQGISNAEASDANVFADQTAYLLQNYAWSTPSMENYRKIAGKEQHVTLIADKSGFINGHATSSASTPLIQNMVNIKDGSFDGDHVVVDAGTYNENVLIENQNLRISGKGKGNTIINGDTTGDGTGDGSVFKILGTSTLNLYGLTIKNGLATKGGGIYNEGDLTVKDSEITLNTATGSPTTSDSNAGKGGGIFNAATGTVTLVRDEITSNTANRGGGLANLGTAEIYGSAIGGETPANGNTAQTDNGLPGLGGGIENENSLIIDKDQLTGRETLISNNKATYGAGVYNLAGVATVSNSQITKNVASYMAGGFENVAGAYLNVYDSDINGNTAGYGQSAGYGGAISNYGQLTVQGCNLLNNYAKTYGGAVFSYGQKTNGLNTLTSVTDSTVTGNNAGRGGAFANRFELKMNFDDTGVIHTSGPGGSSTVELNFASYGGTKYKYSY